MKILGLILCALFLDALKALDILNALDALETLR